MNDSTAATPATAASIAASSQDAQLQQMELMNQITQTINNANISCAKGTECYERQQINDARNNYKAAVITKENAPQAVDTALKNYLIASRGPTQANQDLMQRYEKNGEIEKTKMTQQFDEWFNNMTNKISTLSRTMETTNTLSTSNRNISNRVNDIANQTNDSINHLNLFERKIHFTGQTVKTINTVEYYIRLVYWLAFLTWIACIIYDRDLTMKTAGLFVLFTVIVLMQDQIIDAAYSLKDKARLISI
jgi:exonuclease VII large subunit